MSAKLFVFLRITPQGPIADAYLGRAKVAHLSGSWRFVRDMTLSIERHSPALRNYARARSFIRAKATELGAIGESCQRIPHRLLAEEQPLGSHASGVRPKTH